MMLSWMGCALCCALVFLWRFWLEEWSIFRFGRRKDVAGPSVTRDWRPFGLGRAILITKERWRWSTVGRTCYREHATVLTGRHEDLEYCSHCLTMFKRVFDLLP